MRFDPKNPKEYKSDFDKMLEKHLKKDDADSNTFILVFDNFLYTLISKSHFICSYLSRYQREFIISIVSPFLQQLLFILVAGPVICFLCGFLPESFMRAHENLSTGVFAFFWGISRHLIYSHYTSLRRIRFILLETAMAVRDKKAANGNFLLSPQPQVALFICFLLLVLQLCVWSLSILMWILSAFAVTSVVFA